MATADPVTVAPVNLAAAAARIAETWSPRVVGGVNDVVVKVARFDGDFVWHDHPDTDEAFLCLGGEFVIDVLDGPGDEPRAVRLTPGDLYVVARGVRHRPHSGAGALVALVEAAGTVNTGDVDSPLTAPVDRPIGS